MIAISATDKALCSARQNVIDHARTASLQYLGNYQRTLPISMARMMENAYDWEHLPYIHASSFSAIEKVSSGPWGWRAKVRQSTGDQGCQVLELLVDREKDYWATCVIDGPGQGVEIHTQASTRSENEIGIDVRFYSSVAVPDDEVEIYLAVLTAQYTVLYDEDVPLMAGRQSALDSREKWRNAYSEEGEILVGDTSALAVNESTVVATPAGRYCVRRYSGKWVVHSAVCSHLLGPLEESVVSDDGSVTCPWHGYRFNIETGENLDGKCEALKAAPTVKEEDDKLFLVFGAG